MPTHIQAQKLHDKFSPEYPIALFPLRVETRFIKTQQTASDGTSIDPSIGEMTSISESLIDVAGATTLNMDKLENNLENINKHFSSIQYEQTKTEKYTIGPMARWKATMVDAHLEIHANKLLLQYRKAWQKLLAGNQHTEEQIAKIGKLQAEANDKYPKLSTALKQSVEKALQQLQKIVDESHNFDKFTAQGLVQQQEMTNATLQQIHTIFSTLKSLHPEDKRIFDQWKKNIATLEKWNNQALSAIQQVDQQISQRQEKLVAVQSYFQNLHEQNVKSEEFSAYATNWKHVINIRERLRLARQVQKDDNFQEALETLAPITRSFNQLQKNITKKGGVDHYTQGQIGLLESLVLQHSNELHENWQAYLKQVQFYRTQIQRHYNYSSKLAKNTAILQNGTTSIELLSKHITAVQQYIYEQIYNAEHTLKTFLTSLPKLEQLFEELPLALVHSKIEKGAEDPMLLELLAVLEQAYEQFIGYLKENILSYGKQVSRQKNQFKRQNAQLQELQAKSFKTIPYLDYWKAIQATHVALEMPNNNEGITTQLAHLVKSYEKGQKELPENQHYATVELVGKSYQFIHRNQQSQENIQYQLKLWLDQFQQATKQLQSIQWTIDKKAVRFSPTDKQLFSLELRKVAVLLPIKLDIDNVFQHSSAVLEQFNHLYLTLNTFKSLTKGDGKAVARWIKSLTTHLQKWLDKLTLVLEFYQKEQAIYAEQLKTIEKYSSTLEAPFRDNPRYQLWLKKHQLDGYNQTIGQHNSMNQPFQNHLVQNLHKTAEQLVKINTGVGSTSLEYRHEIFKAVTTAKDNLQHYLHQYQHYWHTLRSFDNGIQSFIRGTDDSLTNRMRETELHEDAEAVSLQWIETARQQLTRLTTGMQLPSVLIGLMTQFYQSFQQIQDSSLLIQNISEKNSSLPKAFETLKEAYQGWRKGFLEHIEKSASLLSTGEKAFQFLERESEEIGTTNSGNINAKAAPPNTTSVIHTPTVICTLPPHPIDTGGGGGDPDPPDPIDPVVLQEYELWIRVYPDYAAINTHDQKLTPTEIQAGIDFWTDFWFAAGNRGLEIGAWRHLVEKYGSQRAAWIVKKLRPLNMKDKPNNPVVVSDTMHHFLQHNLSTDTIIKGVGYWQMIHYSVDNPKQISGINSSFEKNFTPQNAALIAHLTRSHELTESLNPTTKKNPTEGQSKKPTAKFINTVVKKAKSIHVQQVISPLVGVYPQFPSLDPVKEIKQKSWDSAPYTNILPDQLVFMVYDQSGHLRYEKIGALIPTELQTGPDPNNLAQFDPTQPDLAVDGDIKWMTDFEEAVAKGMAIKISVLNEESDPTLATSGFSKVFVTGVKHFDREDTNNNNTPALPNNSVHLLEQLFEGHHYTRDGMSILKPGTPTNSTSQYKSPYLQEESIEASFAREIEGLLPINAPANSTADGHALSKTLGLNDNTFRNIENSDYESIANAERINQALWMSTWGYFLEEMDNHYRVLDDERTPIIPQNAIDALKDFFVPSVKGRGAVPALRVGSQPYGILPTSSFHYRGTGGGWTWHDIPAGDTTHDIDTFSFYDNLGKILLEHFWGYQRFGTPTGRSQKWERIVQEEIFTVDDPVLVNGVTPNFGTGLTATQERFMKILRLHPRSIEFFSRYGTSIGSHVMDNTQNFSQYLTSVNDFNAWLGFHYSFDQEFGSYYLLPSHSPPQIDTAHTLLGNLKLLNPVDNTDPQNPQSLSLPPLEGPIVDDTLKPSETRTLSPTPNSNKNYIEWLLQIHPKTLYTHTKQHTEPSRSLLYHNLKNALFNHYWDACARILEDTGNQTMPIYKDLSFRHFNLHPNPHQPVNTYWVYRKTPLPNTRKVKIYRAFNRDRYRDFVIDVSGTIKTPTPQVPQFGDEVIFANGKWPIMNMVILSNEIAGITQNKRLIDFVHEGINNPNAPVRVEHPKAMKGLLEFRAALTALAQLPTAELERLFAEHMDLASHRLDAWILGLVNQRLSNMRQVNPKGIYIGAYGWLLNLKPGGQREAASGGSTYHVLADGSIPEMLDPDNQGHIIAPSLNHALTAAVLKSGYNGHLGGAEEGALAINLSSRRIRKALFYLDGIRNGQPLGALLGYQLERDLIQHGLGQFIQDTRSQFPLNKIPTLNNSPQVDLHNTIDGVALLDAYKNPNIAFPYGISALNGVPKATEDAFIAQIDKIMDAIDALGDLAIAEGTYHVVGGNYARAGAMLKALSQQNYIPEPEVIQTPRTGRRLTHRIGAVMAPITSGNATAFWAGALSPRANAAPTLNAWLAQQLPAPNQILCKVYYKVLSSGNAPTPPVSISEIDISTLGIEPIDFLYLFPDSTTDDNSELAKRCKQALLELLHDANPGYQFAKLGVNFSERVPIWSDDVMTIEELAHLIAPLRQIVLKARPMSALDVVHPSSPLNGNVDDFNLNIPEVQQRVQQLYQAIVTQKSQLHNNFQNLLDAALFGLEITDLEFSEDLFVLADYSDQISRFDKAFEKRIGAYQKIIAKINPTLNHKKQFKLYQEAAQALVGKSFRLLPQFTPHNSSELHQSYTDRNAILPNAQPLEVEGWIMGLSRVREGMQYLEEFSLMQNVLGGSNQMGIHIKPLQLPYRPNDHWVGLEVPVDYYQKHKEDATFVSLDKLSLVLELPSNFSSLSTLSGFIMDEWTELIPNEEETIGVSFHYDEPNAEPPQAILMAIHPETTKSTGKWYWKQLINTLHSTLELAKIRAVEPDQLQAVEATVGSIFDAYAHMLPATFTRIQENNLDGDWYTDYGLNDNLPIYPPMPQDPTTTTGSQTDAQILKDNNNGRTTK